MIYDLRVFGATWATQSWPTGCKQGVGIEIEGIAVHTGTGGFGGVRGPPAHAVKGELKGRKEEMPKVGREPKVIWQVAREKMR